jgi:hypothetical protein
MATNAEVQKSGSENALSTIRKFSRRVQGTGLVKMSRKRRYFVRDASKTVKKKRALKLIKRRDDYRQAVKEGKIAEAPVRGGRPGQHTGTRYPSQNESAPQQGSGLGEGTPIAH